MDLIQVQLGADADAKLSFSKGKVQLLLELEAQKEVDALMDSLIAKYPAMSALLMMLKAAADAQLAQG